MTKKQIGWVVAGVGLVIVLVAAGADLIGLSGRGSGGYFGNRQMLGTLFGVVVLLVGVGIAYSDKLR
jgi:hypothetical protein